MLRGCGACCACSASGFWPVPLPQARSRVPVRCICCAGMPGFSGKTLSMLRVMLRVFRGRDPRVPTPANRQRGVVDMFMGRQARWVGVPPLKRGWCMISSTRRDLVGATDVGVALSHNTGKTGVLACAARFVQGRARGGLCPWEGVRSGGQRSAMEPAPGAAHLAGRSCSGQGAGSIAGSPSSTCPRGP